MADSILQKINKYTFCNYLCFFKVSFFVIFISLFFKIKKWNFTVEGLSIKD